MRFIFPQLALSTALAGCVIEQDVRVRTQIDNWYQAENNKVDILFVVDDSCSMEEEQEILAEGFASFAEQLASSNTEFQLGVISTSFEYSDNDRGELIGNPPFLTQDDDYVTLFAERTALGATGSDKEKGFEAADWAFVNPENDGFLRDEARLLIVFVSDEEDCSDEGALEGQAAEECYRQKGKLVPVTQYMESYRALKDDPDDVLISAIVGTSKSRCEGAYPSNRYAQAAEITGGSIDDICKTDWSDMLDDIGLEATGVRTSFQTSKAVRIDTLKVFVDDVRIKPDEADGWTWDEETWYLAFGLSEIPPRDSEIRAEYEVAPGSVPPAVQ